MSTCLVCKIEKDDKEYYFKDKKTGRKDTTCKSCRKFGNMKYYNENKETINIKKKEHYESKREYYKKKYRDNYKIRIEINPEKERKSRKKWREENREKINKRMRELYNEKYKHKKKEYVAKNKCRINTYRKVRYNTNDNFRITSIYRTGLRRVMKSFKCNKDTCSLNYLNCDLSMFKNWLQYQFNSDMNFSNYGKLWHLDHFIPISSRINKDILSCWYNLQPLYVIDNLKKNDKYPSASEIKEKKEQILNFLELRGEKKSVESIILCFQEND